MLRNLMREYPHLRSVDDNGVPGAADPPEDQGPTPAADSTPAPEYVTKADLTAFGTAMAEQIAAALKPPAPAAPAEPDKDWDQIISDRASDTATMRLLEINKPVFAAQIVAQVAGSLPQNVKDELTKEILGLPGNVVAHITQSPEDLKRLTRMAKGAHAELNPDAVAAPRSGGSGVVGGSTSEEIRMADKFWSDYKDVPGFTKKDAEQMAKDRV